MFDVPQSLLWVYIAHAFLPGVILGECGAKESSA
jgi:hypothetical protein